MYFSLLQVCLTFHATSTFHALRVARMQASLNMLPAPFIEKLWCPFFAIKSEVQFFKKFPAVTRTTARVLAVTSRSPHLNDALFRVHAQLADLIGGCSYPPSLFQPARAQSRQFLLSYSHSHATAKNSGSPPTSPLLLVPDFISSALRTPLNPSCSAVPASPKARTHFLLLM